MFFCNDTLSSVFHSGTSSVGCGDIRELRGHLFTRQKDYCMTIRKCRLSIDVENACNTISRTKMFQEVRSRFPQMLAIADACYGHEL